MGNANSREDAADFFNAATGNLAPLPGVGAPGTLTPALADAEQQPPSPESQLVPTVLQWSQGGGAVFVTGSFNHWGERIPLRRSGGDFVVCLNLLPGTYQYKFIVDNEWRYATDQQTVRDQMGNINNCLTVEDQAIYLHEDPQSGFFGNNPAQAYTQALPDEITLAKEPPNVPAHLAVLPLNMHPIAEPRIASWSMHPPLTVTLQHICMLHNATSTTLSCTHRFRNKFVTIIIHKPAHPPLHEQHMQAAAAAAAAAATSQQQQQQQQQQQFAALQQQQQQQGFALGWTGPPGAQALPAELAPPGPPQRGVSWSSDLMDSSATLSPGRAEMPPPPPPHHTRLAATPGDALPPPLKLPGGPPGPSGGGVAPNGSDAHGLESMDVSRPGSQAAFMDASMGMPPMGALPPGVQMDVSGAMGGAPPFGAGWPLGGVPGAPPHTPFGGAPPPVFGVGPVGPDSHVHGGNAYGRSSAPADQQHHHHAGGHRTDVVMR